MLDCKNDSRCSLCCQGRNPRNRQRSRHLQLSHLLHFNIPNNLDRYRCNTHCSCSYLSSNHEDEVDYVSMLQLFHLMSFRAVKSLLIPKSKLRSFEKQLHDLGECTPLDLYRFLVSENTEISMKRLFQKEVCGMRDLRLAKDTPVKIRKKYVGVVEERSNRMSKSISDHTSLYLMITVPWDRDRAQLNP